LKPQKTNQEEETMKISHTLSQLFLIVFVLTCFTLGPMAEAVMPAPDGGYPGFNTAEGDGALFGLTTGGWNTALGGYSLYNDTTGGANTAVGLNALRLNRSGSFNTAVGLNALYFNQAPENCAFGAYALFANTTATRNSAFGWGALALNTIGSDNTAVGDSGLISNTTGGRNTAVGSGALYSSDTNSENTAIGYKALYSSQGIQFTANSNTAIGSQSLASQLSPANFNTAIGAQALFGHIGNDGNTAVGYQALYSDAAGSYNIALGTGAGYNLTGDNNIDIGNAGVAAESNTIRIGTTGTQTATYVAGIFGATVTDGAPLLVDASGHLGTAVSSARLKDDIKPMDKASEAVLALKPVTFRYKKDSKGIRQFGLVAEEVEKVNPDLVVRDKEGDLYTVRYDQVNAMLLNEFLKEHKKVEAQQSKIEEQEAIIAQLKSAVAQQEATAEQQEKRFHSSLAEQDKQIEALASGLQKVSAQLEMNKSAPQVIARTARENLELLSVRDFPNPN